MTDDTEPNDLNFIVTLEEKTFEALQKDGLSDDEVWNLMIEARGYYFINTFESGNKRKILGLLLLAIHDLFEQFDDDEFSQPAADWVTNGWMIMALACRAGDANIDVKLFCNRQSIVASGPRKRQSLTNDVVDYVMDKLPPDGRGMTGFREYIGACRRLELENAYFDVTPQENDQGKVKLYIFENRGISELDKKARKEVPIGTIASSISRYPERLKVRQAAS